MDSASRCQLHRQAGVGSSSQGLTLRSVLDGQQTWSMLANAWRTHPPGLGQLRPGHHPETVRHKVRTPRTSAMSAAVKQACPSASAMVGSWRQSRSCPTDSFPCPGAWSKHLAGPQKPPSLSSGWCVVCVVCVSALLLQTTWTWTQS